MKDAVQEPAWLSVKEAAVSAGYSYQFVYNAVKAGEIRAYQRGEGTSWKIAVADLDAWVRGEKSAG